MQILLNGFSGMFIKRPFLRNFIIILFVGLVSSCGGKNAKNSGSRGFIQVSPENPCYLQYSSGQPYIPIGINMISPGGKFRDNPDSALYEMGEWMKSLSENGGNYIRIWLSNSFWDIEDKHAGIYSEEKTERIDRLIEMARKYNLKIKMTLEHFRSLTMEENPQMWATKPVYHTSNGGPLDSIREYLTSQEGHRLFLDKVDFYANRYGSDTIFFGWELWNEMNAMSGPQDSVFFDWNKKMLLEVKMRFPDNLVMQSLGSFDDDRVRPLYKRMMMLKENEIAQVHRYLDPGANMEVCKMPMDIICSSAVDEILSYNAGKPVLLAETGAVESRHSGPSRYYPADTAGILLHDILFAPFFSGSAGTGMSWHWDSYVVNNDLWYHYRRFSEAVKGLNPLTEKFVPFRSEKGDVKIYMLRGEKTILLWLRDKRNTWESELRDQQAPSVIEGFRLDLKTLNAGKSFRRISVYDPWKDQWEDIMPEGMNILLPDFTRSLVVRIEKN